MCIFKEFNCDRLIKWINSKFSVEYFVAMLPSWMDLAMDNEWLPDQEVVWNKVPLEWPQRSKLNYPHPDWRNCWSTLLVELGEHLKKEWNISVEVRFIKYYCYFMKIDLNIDLHLPGNPGTWGTAIPDPDAWIASCLPWDFPHRIESFFPFIVSLLNVFSAATSAADLLVYCKKE